MVINKNPICEICGKHAEVEPLGCTHYPVNLGVEEMKVSLIARFWCWLDGWVRQCCQATINWRLK